MEENGKIVIDLPNGTIELTPDEVEVRLSAREDFAAASGGGQVVVLDARVDDSLRREGLAREVVNRIQRARKAMDLAYETRIEVSWNAEGDLAQAIEEHATRIAAETLASSFAQGVPATSSEHDTEIDGTPLALAIKSAGL
jgi:isoleucyl-tRNA synthetase